MAKPDHKRYETFFMIDFMLHPDLASAKKARKGAGKGGMSSSLNHSWRTFSLPVVVCHYRVKLLVCGRYLFIFSNDTTFRKSLPLIMA